MRLLFTSIFALLISISTPAFSETSIKIVSAEQVEWGYLNPLRGALSPGAANLWGDRTTSNATGMLVRFNKGFQSPPHIHNITYRGIVIQGLLHNDDPAADKLWMPTASYWTQPAGENHITAANGDTNVIYLEIDSGPYLVMPKEEAFDNGERPLNVHQQNIVWLPSDSLENINSVDVSYTALWHTANGSLGSMIRLSGSKFEQLKTDGQEFKAVVIAGQVELATENDDASRLLEPASYVEVSGPTTLNLRKTGSTDAIVYIRSAAEYQIEPLP